MYLAIAFACLQFQKNSSFCKQLKRTLVAQAQYQNDVTRFKSPEKWKKAARKKPSSIKFIINIKLGFSWK